MPLYSWCICQHYSMFDLNGFNSICICEDNNCWSHDQLHGQNSRSVSTKRSPAATVWPFWWKLLTSNGFPSRLPVSRTDVNQDFQNHYLGYQTKRVVLWLKTLVTLPAIRNWCIIFNWQICRPSFFVRIYDLSAIFDVDHFTIRTGNALRQLLLQLELLSFG